MPNDSARPGFRDGGHWRASTRDGHDPRMAATVTPPADPVTPASASPELAALPAPPALGRTSSSERADLNVDRACEAAVTKLPVTKLQESW